MSTSTNAALSDDQLAVDDYDDGLGLEPEDVGGDDTSAADADEFAGNGDTDGDDGRSQGADANSRSPDGGDGNPPASPERTFIVQQAIAAGIPAADAQQADTDSLIFALRMRGNQGQQQGQAQQGQQGQQPEHEQPEEFKLDINEDDFEPEAVAIFNKLTEQINKLQANQQEMNGQFQQRDAVEFTQQMDSFFDSIAEDHGEIFGKGHVGQLQANSPELAQRNALIGQMQVIQEGRQTMGQPPLPIRDAAQQALHAVLGNQISNQAQTAARKQVTNQLRDEQGKFTSRPKTRKAAPTEEGATKNAVNAVTQILRRAGVAS